MSAPPPAAARIRALDATLANQIAAGEVVERPASVLKELLENSLDAGATRVQVEAARGGVALLRVRDDGAGIAPEDLALALERHATSKIATLEELESVRSMGFRGEALPSIASVSRLRIESRAAGAEAAWSLGAEGGPGAGAPAPAAHPPGTTVTVRDLFFNTPVRRRFLRTARTELRHLERVFRRLALAAFPVAMSFTHDGRELLRVAAARDAAGRRRRVARLLGARFAGTARELDAQAAGMRLWGWLGAPELGRERTDLQHLLVNARPVADATVRHAVRLGYAGALPDGTQPAWLLYLELDPREVDVNVHPAKQEVRFREARMVHDFVRSAVRAALGTAPAPGAPAAADGAAPARVAEPSRAAVAPPSGAARDGVRLLALLAGGLVVAARGDRVLLARGPELRRAQVRAALARAAGGTPPVARPLLIPQRLQLEAGDTELRLRELAPLGFELRPSGPGTALLLAVPEVLSRIPARELAGTLAAGAGDWVQALSALAGAAPLDDPEEARALLEALERAPDPAPWLEVDAATLDRLR